MIFLRRIHYYNSEFTDILGWKFFLSTILIAIAVISEGFGIVMTLPLIQLAVNQESIPVNFGFLGKFDGIEIDLVMISIIIAISFLIRGFCRFWPFRL